MNTFPIGLPTIDGSTVTTQSFIVSATLRILFRMWAKSRGLASERSADWVGRHQIGNGVPFVLRTTTSSSFGPTVPADPDAIPVARVYSIGANHRLFYVPVDVTSGGDIGAFRGTFQLGNTDVLGRYVAFFSYAVSGIPRSSLSVFESVAGGHASGPIISTASLSFPAGTAFIAHQGSGRVTRGLRPHLDRGD